MRFLSSLNLLSSPNKQVSTVDLGSESLPGFSLCGQISTYISYCFYFS